MSLVDARYDLDVFVGLVAQLVDQEQIRWLADGHSEHAANAEQRKYQILLDGFAGQQFRDLGIV